MSSRARQQWRENRQSAIGNRKSRKFPFREDSITRYINATDLFYIHRRRLPHSLLGDYRTPKSNAMGTGSYSTEYLEEAILTERQAGQSSPSPSSKRRKFLAPAKRGQPNYTDPNKGATGRKVLPTFPGWHQDIVLETWRQNPWLGYHYLICPRCETKRKKLFMPLCTPEEFEDAQNARTWLSQFKVQESDVQGQGVPSSAFRVPRLHNSPGTKLEAQLIDRYGPLLAPRLLCRECLGLRYGYARFTADIKYQRRQMYLAAKRHNPHATPENPWAKSPQEKAEFMRLADEFRTLDCWMDELTRPNPDAPKEIVPQRRKSKVSGSAGGPPALKSSDPAPPSRRKSGSDPGSNDVTPATCSTKPRRSRKAGNQSKESQEIENTQSVVAAIDQISQSAAEERRRFCESQGN